MRCIPVPLRNLWRNGGDSIYISDAILELDQEQGNIILLGEVWEEDLDVYLGTQIMDTLC